MGEWIERGQWQRLQGARDEQAAGPRRGHGRDPGLLGRLRGRALLRQWLAHHWGDGWRVDVAVEARRRGVVRAGRPMGRTRDEVLERVGLLALRTSRHG